MAPSLSKKRQQEAVSASKPPLVFRKSAKRAKTDADAPPRPQPPPKKATSSPTTKSAAQPSKPLKSALKKPQPKRDDDAKVAAAALQAPSQPQQPVAKKQDVKGKAKAKASAPAPAPAPAPTPASRPSTVMSTPTTTWIQPPQPLTSMRIIAGSYERLLYGIQAHVSPDSTASSLDMTLKPMFQFPAHPSSIKCLATAGAHSKWLVTAGADELVKIWDLRRKKEVGSLSGAETYGAPQSLDFPLPSHLLLSAEGVILLYRTRDWALLHTFKGHAGRVNFVSTHPSAKLALSGGQDGVLRAWDLTRGKNLGGTKMGMDTGGEMEQLRWFGGAGKGDFFALLGRTVVRIFRRSMAEVARIGQGTLTGTRLNDIAVWDLSSLAGKDGSERLKDLTLIFVAREDKKVGVYLFDRAIFNALDEKAAAKDDDGDVEEEEEEEEEEQERTLQEIATLQGHTSRVKSIALQPVALPSGDGSWVLTATTISSDGVVRIFNLDSIVAAAKDSAAAKPDLAVRPCAQYNTKGARLTSLSVVGGDGSLPNGKGGDDSDEGEEESDDGEGRGQASESEFESEYEGQEGEDDEAELRKLEEVLRKAQREGIDLDELVRMAEGSDDDDDDDDGEEGGDSEGEDDGMEGEGEVEQDDSGDEVEVESD